MKAAILYNKKNVKIENLFLPSLKKGQVLVKVFLSGVCRSQLMEYLGLRGHDRWLPHLFGHEAVGEVVLTGPGVKKIKKKDRVILTWIKAKGLESSKISFIKKKKIINAGKVTTFSDFTIVSENRTVKISRKIPLKFGTLLGCAFLTGGGLVINKFMKLSRNKTIGVYGLGGVGISALSMLVSLGFNKIVAIDKDKKKLDLAKKLGCKYLFNSLRKNYKKNLIKKIGRDLDYCIEAGGSVKTIEEAFSLISNDGCLFFSSHPQNGSKIKLDPHQLILGKKIYGSWGGFSKPDKDVNIIFDKINKKHIKILESNIKLYPIENLQKAFHDLNNGKVLRAMIKFD